MDGPDSQHAGFCRPTVKRTEGLVQSVAADYQGGEQAAAERTNFTRGIGAVKLIVAIQESEDGGVPHLCRATTEAAPSVAMFEGCRHEQRAGDPARRKQRARHLGRARIPASKYEAAALIRIDRLFRDETTGDSLVSQFRTSMADSVCDHSQATTSGGRIVVEAVVSPDGGCETGSDGWALTREVAQ